MFIMPTHMKTRKIGEDPSSKLGDNLPVTLKKKESSIGKIYYYHYFLPTGTHSQGIKN